MKVLNALPNWVRAKKIFATSGAEERPDSTMVLVDTSVWISHLRKGEPQFAMLLENAEVMVHPFIVGELACGSLKNRKEILSLLRALPMVLTISHEEVLYFIEQRSLAGSGMGYVDVHLLAAAQLENISIWTFDNILDRAASKLHLSFS